MVKILLIIGLPGSGKTTYAINNQLDKEYKVFDEYVSEIGKGWIFKALKDGNNLCLIDANPCVPIIYDGIMKIFKKHDIEVITFENDPERCFMNKPHMRNKIIEFSKTYKPENYNPKKILPVYRQKN